MSSLLGFTVYTDVQAVRYIVADVRTVIDSTSAAYLKFDRLKSIVIVKAGIRSPAAMRRDYFTITCWDIYSLLNSGIVSD